MSWVRLLCPRHFTPWRGYLKEECGQRMFVPLKATVCHAARYTHLQEELPKPRGTALAMSHSLERAAAKLCSVSEVCTAFQEMAWIGFNSILACLDSVTSSSGLSSFLCWELFCFHSHLTCLTSLFKTHLCDCMQSREVKFQIPLLYNQGE